MGLVEIIKTKFYNYNFLIYLFLAWNAIKLFLINSDPIIQILNLLISIGIYFCIEDKNLQIKGKRKINFFVGIVGFSYSIFKSFMLNNVDDKYYYFSLPIGIFFLIIILKPFNEFIHFKKIFILSLLLPLRRIFFTLSNYIIGSLVPPLTWFILFSLGKNPILEGENIYIENNHFILSKGCLGADNLYFVLSTLIIYSCIFRLRKLSNLVIISILSIATSIAMNIFRNTILALVLSSKINYSEDIFYFLHNSYGSLIFTFFSVLIISFFYFKLLNKELDYK